ncbi:Superfamily II DNA or RNA helicase, SNF2 family [Propionispira arboris]|uniref:Superfamily II DNA or RNA helicase, SNF2 family n=1 Tax=Propionispira arboris TaxID=84035 RepID=A0A1H6YKQ6_9FIRM|nr:DEAD/DEAH box helicase [Propionispira arboris]SEJ41908.1 Superfamily II DNA or RNA helicase, SNF2 family [Propionispira arboris]
MQKIERIFKGMIKDSEIQKRATEAVYQRGCRYFKNKAVKKMKLHKDGHYTAEVWGNSIYSIAVHLTDQDTVHSCSCSCPAYDLYDGICKHIVAVLKEMQKLQFMDQLQNMGMHQESKGKLFSLFAEAVQSNEVADMEPLHLIPECRCTQQYNEMTVWLEFKIGRTRQYVMRNVADFVKSMLYEEEIVFGKELTLRPHRIKFDALSQELWDLLRMAYEDEKSLSPYSAASGISKTFDQKRFKLSPSNLVKFFTIMEEHAFSFGLNEFAPTRIKIEESRPQIRLMVNDLAAGGQLSMGQDELVNLDKNFRYLLYNHTIIHKVDEEFSRYIKPLIQCFKEDKHIKIDKKYMPDFFSNVMPEIEKIVNVKVAPSFLNRFEILPLSADIYLDYAGSGIGAKILFSYGDVTFNPAIGSQEISTMNRKILIRDQLVEGQILRFFEQFEFRAEQELYVQKEEEQCYNFLTQALPELTELADIYYSESLKKKPIQRLEKVTAGVSVNQDNLLEVSLNHEGFNLNELLDIISSYRLKKRYHRLKDGTFIPLEDDALAGVADFVENTGLQAGKAEFIRMPLAKAAYIDSLAKEEHGFRLERNQAFKKLVTDLKDPMDADVEVPESLKKILRDYQKVGFRWLATLAKYGLGGILADDMGLGKTLQVIAFLLSQRDDAKSPSLVVAPTSLMYNWLDEIEHFAPELKAIVLAGSKSERREKLATIQGADLVITTYNMLKKDIEEYEKLDFCYCFLDEAQHIKNPGTQNAKAVKRLKTHGYFALTGTPIENTLTELWSIFDFLMPGYLLSHKEFKNRFEIPIIRDQDKHALRDLNRHITPFILRRMKKDVLKELPDKVEGKMINEMTTQQAKVYLGYFMQAKQEFETGLAQSGFNNNRMKILALLTRLRQICCHPSLFLEDYKGGSGKLEMLEEVVHDAVDGGHRLLIFSQFTSMLAMIGAKLKKAGIVYEYLDGHTPALERIERVKAFNSGTQPVFLISLKAGGTGLNLTGADMVIHYDPWWNPAVEDQATDRAYRLGQKKNVQVFKFITKDTIEEKIFALQQKKKALIDQMIQPGDNFLSKLTETEIRELFNTK